jgi:16S rRNA processing protein RimM
MPTPSTHTDTAATGDLLYVGYVSQAHGVRGEVKVRPDTDDPGRLTGVPTLYLGKSPEAAREMQVERARVQPGKGGKAVLLVKLRGATSREDADALRGQSVYAESAHLPPLDDGEVFIHDLIGLAVTDEDGAALGTVADYVETPAHPAFVVERAGQPDALVPDVPAFVVGLDLEDRTLVIRPIEGLL